MTVEICANSAQSCVEAHRGGANRVELCAGIPEGGTTPSIGETLAAIGATKDTDLRLHAIIRPRGGDFLYSELEITAMVHDIQHLGQLPIHGLVFGCLNSDGTIDMATNARLVAAARAVNPALSLTFHRAFDMCLDPHKALEELVGLGFDRVLTSGQAATAPQGARLLKELVQKAAGRIIIMPGCGVNEQNIGQLAVDTRAVEFHFSARHTINSKMEFRGCEGTKMGDDSADEFSRQETSADRVDTTINRLLETIKKQ